MSQVAPTPAPTPAPTSGPTPAPNGADRSWLPEAYRNDKSFETYGSIDDVFKAYKGQETLLGVPKDELVRKPKKGDAASEAAYRAAIGVPAAPEQYKFDPVEGAPALEGDFVAAMREAAHKRGVPGDAMSGLWQDFNEIQKTFANKLQTQAQAARDETVSKLKTEWGDKYDANLNSAQLALNWLDEDFAKHLETTGLGNHPGLLRGLSKIAQELGEDRLIGETKKGSFDGGSLEAAQAELKTFRDDPAMQKILNDRSHPDRPATLARLQQLIDASAGLKANG